MSCLEQLLLRSSVPPQCSLHFGRCGTDVLFRAEHLAVTYCHHFDHRYLFDTPPPRLQIVEFSDEGWEQSQSMGMDMNIQKAVWQDIPPPPQGL